VRTHSKIVEKIVNDFVRPVNTIRSKVIEGAEISKKKHWRRKSVKVISNTFFVLKIRGLYRQIFSDCRLLYEVRQ